MILDPFHLPFKNPNYTLFGVSCRDNFWNGNHSLAAVLRYNRGSLNKVWEPSPKPEKLTTVLSSVPVRTVHYTISVFASYMHILHHTWQFPHDSFTHYTRDITPAVWQDSTTQSRSMLFALQQAAGISPWHWHNTFASLQQCSVRTFVRIQLHHVFAIQYKCSMTQPAWPLQWFYPCASSADFTHTPSPV